MLVIYKQVELNATNNVNLVNHFCFILPPAEPGMGKTSSLALVALEWVQGRF